jgi:hypothetical protein
VVNPVRARFPSRLVVIPNNTQQVGWREYRRGGGKVLGGRGGRQRMEFMPNECNEEMILNNGLRYLAHVCDVLLSPHESKNKFVGEGRSRQEDAETSCCLGWAQPKQAPSPFVNQPRVPVVPQVRNCSE